MELPQLSVVDIETLLKEHRSRIPDGARSQYDSDLALLRRDLEQTRVSLRMADIWNEYARCMNDPPSGISGANNILNHVMRNDGGHNGGVKRRLIKLVRDACSAKHALSAKKAEGVPSEPTECTSSAAASV